jgi:hypothetical protein
MPSAMVWSSGSKLKLDHERILLTVQRGHVLRSRTQLLVLRSPSPTAGPRPRDDRVPLWRLVGTAKLAMPFVIPYAQNWSMRSIISRAKSAALTWYVFSARDFLRRSTFSSRTSVAMLSTLALQSLMGPDSDVPDPHSMLVRIVPPYASLPPSQANFLYVCHAASASSKGMIV